MALRPLSLPPLPQLPPRLLPPLLLGATLLAPGPLAPLAAPPARAADDTLPQSVQQLRRFPFQPNCAGNTQEIVACLWQQRNRGDATLQRLLGSVELREQWRASRRRVCERVAAKAEGGSIQPIVWLSCENALNTTLIDQLRKPLLGP
jgi:uncharacterized protein YecT (DUF1311 family)